MSHWSLRHWLVVVVPLLVLAIGLGMALDASRSHITREPDGLVAIHRPQGWVNGTGDGNNRVIKDMTSCKAAAYRCPSIGIIDTNSQYGQQLYRSVLKDKSLVQSPSLTIDGQTVQYWVGLYPNGHTQKAWYAPKKHVLVIASDKDLSTTARLSPETDDAIRTLVWTQ